MNIPNPEVKASNHFSWKELLWLPQWNRMANESDGLTQEVLDNLNSLALKMDQVRNYFNASINVHVTYRSPQYNALVKGATHSAHLYGLAMDFDVSGLSCSEAIQKILADNKLEQWNMRMENNGPTPTWIHLGMDWKPGMNRYFIP